MQQAQIDKDMEEILSSIRQIIADDVEENSKAKTPKISFETSSEKRDEKKKLKENKEDILELTNMLPEDVYKGPSDKEIMRSAPQVEAIRQEEQVVLDEQKSQKNSAIIEKSDALISSEVAREVSKTIEDLSLFIMQTESQKEALNPVFREMIQESLQPLLRTWLDQNLSKIVKEMVAEQIEKILKRP